MSPDRNLVGDDGYAYHATNVDNLAEISRVGIKAHKPSFGTDQEAWPDGGAEHRSYFVDSRNAGNVWQFAPEHGEPVVVRVKRADVPLRRESTGDLYTRRPVPPEKVEVLTGDGWKPVSAPSGQVSWLDDAADAARERLKAYAAKQEFQRRAGVGSTEDLRALADMAIIGAQLIKRGLARVDWDAAMSAAGAKPGDLDSIYARAERVIRLNDGAKQQPEEGTKAERYFDKTLAKKNRGIPFYGGVLGGFGEGRGMRQIDAALPEAGHDLRRAASFGPETTLLMQTSLGRIDDLVGAKEFINEVIKSRLEGRAGAYEKAAQAAEAAEPKALLDSYDTEFRTLLEKLDSTKKFSSQKVLKAADKAAKAGDAGVLRSLLIDRFEAAQSQVHKPAPNAFDADRSTPEFQEAANIWKTEVQPKLEEATLRNGGSLDEDLGPLGIYMPASAIEALDKPASRFSRQKFGKPGNPADKFFSGFSELGYSVDVRDLRKKIMGALASNNLAGAFETMEDGGLIQRVGPKDHTGDTIDFRGKTYTATRVPIGPGQDAFMPDFVADELDKFLGSKRERVRFFDKRGHLVKGYTEGEAMGEYPKGKLDKIANLATLGTMSGIGEPLMHAKNIEGALVSATPYLEALKGGNEHVNTALNMIPMVKRLLALKDVTGAARLLGVDADIDPAAPERVAQMQRMAENGQLSPRFGTVTMSAKRVVDASRNPFRKQADELTGAKLDRHSLSAVLNGPEGMDVRARILLDDIGQKFELTPQQQYELSTRVGQYNSMLADGLSREMKANRVLGSIAPFYTAASTMLRNGIDAMTSGGVMPGGAKGRMQAQLTGGAVKLFAIYALSNLATTGEWPWDDKKQNFPATRLPDKPESLFDKKKQGEDYVNLAGIDSPGAARGATAMGLKAVNTLLRGGDARQVYMAWLKDAANAAARPFFGPATDLVLRVAFNTEPSIASTVDRGKPGVSLQRFDNDAKPGGLGDTAILAGKSLVAGANPTLEKGVSAFEKGTPLLRAIVDQIESGALQGPINLDKQRTALTQERNTTARAKWKAK